MAYIHQPPPTLRHDDRHDRCDASTTPSSSSSSGSSSATLTGGGGTTATSSSTAGTSTLLADLCWSSGATDADADGDSHRTSNASSTLPWAAETVAENRQLWLHIEQMLYGERELPAAGALRTELQQWQRHWPHLRVVGERVKITATFGPVEKASWSPGEEVFAIHPSPPQSQSGNSNWRRPTMRRTGAATVPSGAAAERMLEHCLRISSSSWSRRPTTTMLATARRTFRRQPPAGLVAVVGSSEAYDDDDEDDDADGETRINSVRSEIQRVRYVDEDNGGDDSMNQTGILPVLRARALQTPTASGYRLHAFRPLLAGSRMQPAAKQSVPVPDVRQNGNAAIRRRTILPPIGDDQLANGGVNHRTVIGRGLLPKTTTATTSASSSISDVFGRSVSAVYVPSLNI